MAGHWGRPLAIGFLASMLLAASGCGKPQRNALDVEPQGGKLVLSGATVVDVRTGALIPNRDITLDQGKILSVAASGSARSDADTTIIDAKGKFVVPGFNDMHAHILSDPDPAADLALMLANGITGFRQMHGSPELLRQRRDHRLPLFRQSPALLAMPGAPLLPLNAGTAEEAVATIRQQKKDGADFIKVVIVDPKVFLAAQKEARRLGLPFAGHIPPGTDALAATRGGMKSIEHMGPAEAFLIPASNDEAELEHMASALPPVKPPPKWLPFKNAIGAYLFRKKVVNPLIDTPDETLRITDKALATADPKRLHRLALGFAANGTWQVPTLIREKTMAWGDAPKFRNDPNLRYMPSDTVDLWNEVADDYAKKVSPKAKRTFHKLYAAQVHMIRIFDGAGVKMLVGTDFGGTWLMPGFSIHQEFDELAKAGLSPLRILQMTTLNVAEFLNRTTEMGTVEQGKRADLVILDANPIDSVQNLHRIHAVVRAGDYYSPATLKTLLEQARRRQSSL